MCIRDSLIVGDQDVGLDPGVLQSHPVRQRAEVVTQVQVPGGTVTGHHPEGRRVDGDPGFDLGAARLGAAQGGIGGGGGELIPGVLRLVGHGFYCLLANRV